MVGSVITLQWHLTLFYVAKVILLANMLCCCKHEACPRCGGAVFEAEKVVEKGLAYHKKCFTCSKCNRPQDDKLQVR